MPRLPRQDRLGLGRYLPTEETLRRYLPDYLLPRKRRRASRPAAAAPAPTTAEDLLGIHRPENGFLWFKDGAAAKVLVVQPINLDLRTDHERERILTGEKELLNALAYPVQRLIYAEPLDLTDYLEREQAQVLRLPPGRRRQILFHHLSHLAALVQEQKLVRWRRFLILRHPPHTDRRQVMATLEKRTHSLVQALKSKCHLTAQALDDFGLARMVDMLLDPLRAMSDRLQPAVLDSEELDAELAVQLDFSAETYYRIGSRYARIYMITGYPHGPGEGWLGDLYQWHAGISISQHLEPANGTRLIRELNNSIKESGARLAGELSHDRRKIEEQKVEDADRLIRELAVGNHRVIDVSMYLQITAESLEELDRLSSELEGYLGGKHMNCRMLKWQEMIDGFCAWLPLGLNDHSQAHRHQIPAAGVASMFPWSSAELTMTTGRFRGINLHTQNVCVLNPEELPNPHEAVLAFTGGGKSVEMHLDMLHRWASGRRVLCLDPERDKGYLCRIVGGQMVRLTFGGRNRINPMQARRRSRNPDLDEGDDAEEVSNALQAQVLRQRVLFSLIYPAITPVELSKASTFIMELYRERQITADVDPGTVPHDKWPTWDDLVVRLLNHTETQQFGAVLQDWISGPFAGIMNGHTTVELDADFVVIDVADLKMNPSAQRPVFYLALTYLWDEIDRDWSEPKDLYCDEMGILVDSQGGLQAGPVDMALWFLWMISKCARKRNCRMKAATQNPADFLSAGPYALGIIENCHTVVLGLQKRSSIEKLRRIIDLSDQEEAELLRMPPAHKLFIVGQDRALVHVIGSHEEMQIADRRYREAHKAPARG